MHVEQSYFDQINEEIKTVEARPYYPTYHGSAEGDSILLISPSGEELLVGIEKKLGIVILKVCYVQRPFQRVYLV